MEKGEPRRPPAKPQFAAGVPASPQWKHDFTLTGEKVADRYAAVGYLEISVVRGGRMLDPSSTPSSMAPRSYERNLMDHISIAAIARVRDVHPGIPKCPLTS
jgi:hypothetical protein